MPTPSTPFIIKGTVYDSTSTAESNSKITFTTSQGSDTFVNESDGTYVYDLANVGYTDGETVLWSAEDKYGNQTATGSFDVTGGSLDLDINLSEIEVATYPPGNRDSQIYNIGGKPVNKENSFPTYLTKLEISNKAIELTNPFPVYLGDSPSIDSFGRLRVSNPETLFDSKNVWNDPDLASNVENQPLFYDNQETSGSGTSTAYRANESSTRLSVSATTAGTRVRQTKQRFNYQPGKSLLCFLSFNFIEQKSGITKHEGLFDDNNGLFLEDNGSEYRFVIRTSTSGSPVDNVYPQDQWNVDKMDGTGKSGVSLDFSKTQILAIEFEWLGVGRVRFGFVINGVIYYAHEVNNANNQPIVYMKIPNLPIKTEISNDGTGGASHIDQICSTVISEGGQIPLGLIRSANTGGTHLNTNTENTTYALLGIRLKTAYIGEKIELLEATLQIHTNLEKLLWEVYFNPTVAGTFTYVDETNSAIQVARGATSNTVSGGILLSSGFIESGNRKSGMAGSKSLNIKNSLNLGSNIDGTVDEIVLCVTPIAGSTNVKVEGALTWREYN